MAINTAFTMPENELLLLQTAAVRRADHPEGCGVILTPAQRVFCRCDDEADAKLIAKLFNRGLSSSS